MPSLHSPRSELSNFAADSLALRYGRQLSRMAELATEAGYPIQAFTDSSRSRFLDFSFDEQSQLLSSLETCNSICESAVQNGIALRKNGLALAWWAMKSFKLRPTSGVFSYLKPGDIIEIYDQNDVQIFRTFDFLKCVSYSLDEVHTYRWWELYERAEAVTEKMLSVAKEVGSATRPITFLAPFATHSMTEKFSARRLVAQVESRLVSTLMGPDGEPRAYMNAFSLISISDAETSNGTNERSV